MFAKRLAEIMRERGINGADLARACRITPQSVSGWLLEKTRAPRPEHLYRASVELGVTMDWLAVGSQPKYRHASLTSDDEDNLLRAFRAAGNQDRRSILALAHGLTRRGA